MEHKNDNNFWDWGGILSKRDFLASELVTEALSDNQLDACKPFGSDIYFLGLLCQTVEVIWKSAAHNTYMWWPNSSIDFDLDVFKGERDISVLIDWIRI